MDARGQAQAQESHRQRRSEPTPSRQQALGFGITPLDPHRADLAANTASAPSSFSKDFHPHQVYGSLANSAPLTNLEREELKNALEEAKVKVTSAGAEARSAKAQSKKLEEENKRLRENSQRKEREVAELPSNRRSLKQLQNDMKDEKERAARMETYLGKREDDLHLERGNSRDLRRKYEDLNSDLHGMRSALLAMEHKTYEDKRIYDAKLHEKEQELQKEVELCRDEFQKQESVIQEKESIVQEKESLIQEKESIIQQKDSVIQQKESIIKQKESVIQQKTEKIGQKDHDILQKDKEMQKMKHTIEENDNDRQTVETKVDELLEKRRMEDS